MIRLDNAVVMIAGGAGFVGSAVVREILERGARVVCFDNYIHGVPESVQGLDGPIDVIRGDALDEWSLARAIERHRVEYVIDCIGDTFVPTAYEVPGRFFDINLRATYNLLEACRLFRIKRMLYVSSTEVYGDCAASRIDEQVRLDPVNTYAVSKLAADRLCATYAIEHGAAVLTARIFNCYGPRETQPYIVPEIISQLCRGPVLRLGNLEAERDFTYVHDTARALVSVLVSDLPYGDVVNVGSGTAYSVRWLAETIARLMGVRISHIELDEKKLRRRDIHRFVCDNTRLQELTGWTPHVPIEEGLEQTIRWFEEHGNRWSWESFVKDGVIYR